MLLRRLDGSSRRRLTVLRISRAPVSVAGRLGRVQLLQQWGNTGKQQDLRLKVERRVWAAVTWLCYRVVLLSVAVRDPVRWDLLVHEQGAKGIHITLAIQLHKRS